MKVNKADMLELEKMVDTYGLREVMYALANVCADKADHLATNWQDEKTAKEWEKRMAAIEKVAATLPLSY